MQVDKVYDNVKSKAGIVPLLVKKYGISAGNMCFVGDDLVDIGLMRSVGLPIAVANACPEVKKASLWVTSKKGGSGAVRQVCEAILKAQGKWRSAIKAYE
jgi:3-deoxy-D-manno-octulosonate 8-phosphate phosphatase (KDO 8-P phosphatase)